MHAVVVNLTIVEPGDDLAALREQVVPQAAEASGFVAGYWTRKDNSGLSLIVFDSEDAAVAEADRIRSMFPDPVATLDSVDVREVVAHA